MDPMTSTSQDAANILDIVPEAYVRLDSEFRYTFVNHAADRLLGKDRAELLGNVLWEVYPMRTSPTASRWRMYCKTVSSACGWRRTPHGAHPGFAICLHGDVR
jgi:PAS domain-containing protein